MSRGGLLWLVALALGVVPAQAQDTVELAVAGARARAMGGAGTALRNEIASVSLNPAGLAALEGGAAQADIRITSGGGTTPNPDALLVFGGAVPALSFTDEFSTETTYNLIGGALRVPGQALEPAGLVAAVSFRRLIDLLYTQGQVLSFDPGGNVEIPLEHKDTSEGGVDAFTVSVAAAPHERVHVGVNANILTGTLDQLDEDRVAFGGQLSFLDSRSRHSKLAGFSIEAGVLVEAHEMVTVGATLRPGYTIESTDGTEKVTLFTPPGLPGFPPVDDTFEFEVPDSELEVPLFYSVGVAVTPFEDLVLVGDYHFRPWDESVTRQRDASGQFVEVEAPSYATTTAAFGGEYTWRPGGNAVPLRAGYRFHPTIRANVDSLSAAVNPAGFRTFRGDRVEGHAVTFGSGLHFETVHFDVSLERTSITHTEFALDQVPVPGQPILTVELDETFTTIYLSSTLWF